MVERQLFAEAAVEGGQLVYPAAVGAEEPPAYPGAAAEPPAYPGAAAPLPYPEAVEQTVYFPEAVEQTVYLAWQECVVDQNVGLSHYSAVMK